MRFDPFWPQGVRSLLAFWIVLSIALPAQASPLATLRAGSPRQTPIAVGLEEALRFADPPLRDTYEAL